MEVRFFDGKTQLDGERVAAETQSLTIEAYIQIRRANFKVISTSSLATECKIYQDGLKSPHSPLDEMTMLSILSSSPLASTVENHDLQQSPSLADFKKGKHIGRGGQGGVYRYYPANAKQQLVVNLLELFENEKEKVKQAISEVMISSILDHVSISICHLRLG